jgi:DNA-binding MarR family transcriptional regulator
MILERIIWPMTATRRVSTDRDPKPSATHSADIERTAETIRVLMEVGNAANTVVAQVLTEFEVSPSVAGVLWAIVPGDSPPTPRDVAARLGCDPSTVSLAVDKLESMGLVARQPHPKDGRKRTLVLTSRGQDLWEALSTRLHTAGVFAGLDAAEQRDLHALLMKVRLPHHS